MSYLHKTSEKHSPSPDFLSSAQTLDDFVHAWEGGTLPRTSWSHPAHVAVIAFYAFGVSPEIAFQRMKAGILHYATCVGIVNNEDSGYHESVTRFWSNLVWEFVQAGNFASCYEAACAAVSEFGDDRDRYRPYYSFDVVKDRRARREWVPPDLRPV